MKLWKRWMADVLGLPKGLQITVPPGATLILGDGTTVETLNMLGGTSHFKAGEQAPGNAIDFRPQAVRCTEE